MPQTGPPQPDGPRDCGRFFLDVVGQFPPEHLAVRWSGHRRSEHPDVEASIEQTWAQRRQQASQEGCKLFNGALCRLVGYRQQNGHLQLQLGPVSYREFLGTNLVQPHIRYLHGPEVLADPLGVSAALTTTDGYIALTRRSELVVHYPRLVHPVAGMVEAPAEPGELPSPMAALVAEVGEELGLPPAQLGRAVCLGLVRDKRIVQPELIFDLPVEVASAQLRAAARSAVDADENADLVLIRDDGPAVIDALKQYRQDLTPVGLAALLLHGRRRWGTGWFASTRGFLHGVI